MMTPAVPTALRVVADETPQLEAVKKLWRTNSATLGFFPDGAFAEYAQRGHIIAAEREGKVVGYTLFRRTGTRVAIVHLCVDPAARGSGIARQLVDEVSRLTPDADGVSLRCRRDFDADKIWPRLGFRPLREIQGRGKDGTLLILWFKSHGNEDLFTLAAKKREPRTTAVVDANVFFDLAEAEERTANESKALLADWLRDILELKITRELFREIDRNDDHEVRRRNLDFAGHFEVVDFDQPELTSAQEAVESVLPPARNDRDRSDREHLAICVAAQVGYFVTRDDLLREYADPLWERTKVEVLRPSELIADLDEIERGEAYRPARFAGTSMRLVPAKELPEERIAETFRGPQRRSEFLSLLRTQIASARTTATHVVLAADAPVALISRATDSEGCLTVSLMKVAGHDGRTLASYLAHHIRVEAVEHAASVIAVEDAGLDSTTRTAVEEDEFTLVDGMWLRLASPIPGTRAEFREWVAGARARSSRPSVASFLAHIERDGSLALPAADLERKFWPLKILDSSLQTFVVPVRAHWAQHLFDAELARLDLFGAKPHLAMSRENVYYRSPTNPAYLPAPARILWYVSADTRTPGTKAIRACSRLVACAVGTPKIVYKAGRRLGIYEWKDVSGTAAASRSGQVQSLRFCDTECFQAPVALERVHAILDECGADSVNRSFPAPQPVPEDVFAAIYRAGSQGALRGR